MADWKTNSIMFWRDASGVYQKITDHGRDTLSESSDRISTDTRMADGSLRRYSVAKKRTWNVSWSLIPSTNTVATGMKTVDAGFAGEDIERFYRITDGAFRMVLRRGSAIDKPIPVVTDAQLPFANQDFEIVNVMFTDFSKNIVKRGRVDLWDLDLTLEEV